MLTTGQVLVSGGVNFVTHKLTELASAELYNPCGQVRPVRRRSEHLTPIPRPACTVPTPPFPSGSAGGTAPHPSPRTRPTACPWSRSPAARG